MNEFRERLNAYYEAWHVGFASKDANQILDFMSKDFKGFWSNSILTNPEQYDYNYDIVSVLKSYSNPQKSFELITLSERKMGEEVIVLGTESTVINGDLHAAKCMYIWRKENGDWKLLREYIELED